MEEFSRRGKRKLHHRPGQFIPRLLLVAVFSSILEVLDGKNFGVHELSPVLASQKFSRLTAFVFPQETHRTVHVLAHTLRSVYEAPLFGEFELPPTAKRSLSDSLSVSEQ